MKTLEKLGKLQESYEKEIELAKKHKQRADELKLKIEEQKTLVLHRKTQELQLTSDEYEKLLDFLSNKESVMSVLSLEEVKEVIMLSGAPKNGEEEMMRIEET